jgi:hypothetical protein
MAKWNREISEAGVRLAVQERKPGPTPISAKRYAAALALALVVSVAIVIAALAHAVAHMQVFA